MHINKIDISRFGAKVQNKMINHSTKRKTVKWNQTHKPSIEEEVEEGNPISIRLLFEADTRDMVHRNISNFLVHVTECDIKFENLSNNYHCYYDSHSIEETKIDEWLFLNIEFVGYEYSDELISNIDYLQTGVINNIGNKSTTAILEVIPRIDLIDLEISGLTETPITIKNLKANKKIILNGEEGTVTVDGINKFDDVDMWEFPFLVPGENKIKISKDSAKIAVKYKAIWR